MSTEIARMTDISDEKLGLLLAKSNYFQDAREAGQAIVKVLAGREIGLGPIASMTGIYVISGRVSFGANVMAAALKRTGRYTYRVTEHTDERCVIEFFEIVGGKRESLGVSSFTMAEARKAGTKNLDKFPRNMLFARAMSNGVRWFAPDVFAGAPVYTPEELGANVNEDGDVIDATPRKPATTSDDASDSQADTETADLKAQAGAMLKEIGASGDDVRRVLGTTGVMEWLAAEGHTIDKLKSLVLDGMVSTATN